MRENHLERVRRICFELPETEERLSHGEPTFFVGKRVFVMFDVGVLTAGIGEIICASLFDYTSLVKVEPLYKCYNIQTI